MRFAVRHHEGEAFLDQEVVASFRESRPDLPSFAVFQLVSFSDGSAVVCVRGTVTSFDFLVDARLWYSSALFQLVQSALPLGFAFDGLIKFCVNMLSYLESSSVQDVSYYMETTGFVNFLKENGNYTNVAITGHSLGGGLALISGAQTKVKSIAISAPSAVMGRETLNPPVSLDDIKLSSYSLIPENDVVSYLGGAHMSAARIRCRASSGDFLSCHYASQSLCELLYMCGNTKRPVYCECVQLGYPEPTAIDGSGESFASICPNL